MARRKHGFTLIELSIVLVIIGLIVGGVFIGRALIYSAQVRAGVRDIDKIKSAITTFRVKYGCLPGDCKNATSFFSNLNGDEYPYGWGNLRNGNGNGEYDQLYEGTWRFWEHLSAAGLWNGPVGVAVGAGANWTSPGVNVPSFSWLTANRSRIADTNYLAQSYTILAIYGHINFVGLSGWEANQNLILNKYTWNGKNRLVIAGIDSNNFYYGYRGSPCNFMYDIDVKIDDGLPHTGQARMYGSAYSCSGFNAFTGVPPATGYTYTLNNDNLTGTLAIDQ